MQQQKTTHWATIENKAAKQDNGQSAARSLTYLGKIWTRVRDIRQKGLPLAPYGIQRAEKDQKDCIQIPNLKMQISGEEFSRA